MVRRRKYLFGAMVVCIALGILIFTGLNSCSVYYYTVSEILEKAESKYGDTVRVSGSIVSESVTYDPDKPELRFIITDDSATLPIIFQDERPHTFEENKDVVVEGEIKPDGVFEAHKLVMKCASKYEAED